MVGAVLSTFALTDVRALLPALSTAVPEADWLSPSPKVCAAEQVLTPDRLSAQVKLTVTSVLFQPLLLATGALLPVMVGFVLSTLIPVTAVAAVFSALSTAVPEA